MVGILGSVVKIVKQKIKIGHTFPQCFDPLSSFIFMELSDSSMGEDLTTPLSLTKSLKNIFKFGESLEPSTTVGRMQYAASGLHTMVLPR
jgi:hypothetical protein